MNTRMFVAILVVVAALAFFLGRASISPDNVNGGSVVTPVTFVPAKDTVHATTVIERLKLRLIKDTVELRAAQVEAARYRAIADSLLSRPDSLSSILPGLIAPAEATSPVSLQMGFANYPAIRDTLVGSLSMKYIPLDKRFSYSLQINPLNINIPTVDRRTPFWQRSGIAILAATSAFALTKEQYTLAAVAAGGAVILIQVNF